MTTTTTTAPRRRPSSTTSSGRGTATTPSARASSPAGNVPEPPLHVGWRFQDYALLEFPPVIYGNSLYVIDDDGSAKELDSRTGHKVWETKVGTLAAASPALGVKQGLLYLPVLSRPRPRPRQRAVRGAVDEDRPGRVVEGDSRRHRVLADRVRQLGLLRRPGRDRVLAERDHRPRQLDLPRQRARSRAARRCLERHPVLRRLLGPRLRGERRHRTPGLGRRTPTAPTSGSARATSTRRPPWRSGACTWATPTGASTRSRRRPVSSRGPPARAPTCTRRRRSTTRPGSARRSTSGPTTATSTPSTPSRARSAGSIPPGGKISGSATIVGNVVYYSDLGTKTTAGLDVRTGRKVFSFPDGAFNPVVADDGTIYLSGYTMLYQMLPKRSR